MRPSLLIWARESLGLAPDEAAKKIGVKPERLAEWEAGEASPSVAQLRKAAQVYKRPLAVFFGSRVDEDSPTEPRSESGRALLEAENVLRSFADRVGLNYVILRLAGLYGPNRILRRAALERGDPIPGDPDHILNLIHIDDAARCAAALLTRDDLPRNLYLASDDHPVPRREFYEFVARHLALPPPRFLAGTPASRDTSHKRVDSRRIKADLNLECNHSDFRSGIAASV